LAGDNERNTPVSVARALYERFRQLIHEFAKFGIIGVVGLIITNGGYDLLHAELGVGPLTSTTSATIVATAVAFVGNRHWTFRHRERTGVARESVVFFVLNGIGLLIQDAAVGFNYYVVGLHDKASGFIALNIGIAIATVFRFWSYRRWVWGGSLGGVPLVPLREAGTDISVGSGAGRDDDVSRGNGHVIPETAGRPGSPQVR
jgi:putative flippase GtrA